MNTLILMRGVPGGGKTTLARELATEHISTGGSSVAICSTDDYHMEDGKYVFKRDKLGDFHRSNQIRVYQLMQQQIELVIVDNTNIKRKDMQVYISNAGACKYQIKEVVVGEEFLIPNMDIDPHCFNAYIQVCAERNTHGVPQEHIERMARNFQE